MKELEKEYRTYLPKKSYAVIRVDGKGFSKYTKGLEKPFDMEFTEDMRETAKYLCENVDGAHFAYTQSDEISVVFSDLGGPETEWWFGGQVQKLVSITAAMATAQFNALRCDLDQPFALFDARVHHLDGADGVLDYVRWRQEDAIRNSVSMLASAHFSHRELNGVSVAKRMAMLEAKGLHWIQLDASVRRGSWVHRELRDKTTTYVQNGEEKTIKFQRREWVVENSPLFDSVGTLGLAENG